MQQEQFKQEIIPLRGRLIVVAQRMLGNPDDAEDVVQETFLKLWYMRERLAEIRNIPALSVQITKNACLNRIKARQKISEKPGTDSPADTATPYQQLEARDSLERTMRIIDTLPDLQQAILRMKHVDGLEVEEIAQLTGSNSEAVRMNLSRARRKVKDIFMKTER